MFTIEVFLIIEPEKLKFFTWFIVLLVLGIAGCFLVDSGIEIVETISSDTKFVITLFSLSNIGTFLGVSSFSFESIGNLFNSKKNFENFSNFFSSKNNAKKVANACSSLLHVHCHCIGLRYVFLCDIPCKNLKN